MTGCEAYPVGLGSDLSDSEDLECHENKWEASEIVSGLYVGSIASARDSCALEKKAIDLVISVHDDMGSQKTPVAKSECGAERRVEWIRIELQDRADADLLSHLDKCADVLAMVVDKQGGAALIHCLEGSSVSTSVAIAFLVKHRAMNLRDAVAAVTAKRDECQPNRGFWRQLVAFEDGCRGETTYAEEDLPGSVTSTILPLICSGRVSPPRPCPQVMFEREALDAMIESHLKKAKQAPFTVSLERGESKDEVSSPLKRAKVA